MVATINNNDINISAFIWAIICSFLLHILFAVVVPSFSENQNKKNVELTVELVKSKPPEPVPVVLPKQILPAQNKPEPIKKIDTTPKPITKPLPKIIPKSELITEPQTIETPQPVEQPAVITATPKADAPPAEFAAPKSQPAIDKPVKVEAARAEPSEQDVSDALSAYGDTLGRAIAKHKNYPKIARMRGWQGE